MELELVVIEHTENNALYIEIRSLIMKNPTPTFGNYKRRAKHQYYVWTIIIAIIIIIIIITVSNGTPNSTKWLFAYPLKHSVYGFYARPLRNCVHIQQAPIMPLSVIGSLQLAHHRLHLRRSLITIVHQFQYVILF